MTDEATRILHAVHDITALSIAGILFQSPFPHSIPYRIDDSCSHNFSYYITQYSYDDHDPDWSTKDDDTSQNGRLTRT